MKASSDENLQPQLDQIFCQNDVVREDVSYHSRKKNDSILKAISDVVFLELGRDAERGLLEESFSLNRLYRELTHRVTAQKTMQFRIRMMGIGH